MQYLFSFKGSGHIFLLCLNVMNRKVSDRRNNVILSTNSGPITQHMRRTRQSRVATTPFIFQDFKSIPFRVCNATVRARRLCKSSWNHLGGGCYLTLPLSQLVGGAFITLLSRTPDLHLHTLELLSSQTDSTGANFAQTIIDDTRCT